MEKKYNNLSKVTPFTEPPQINHTVHNMDKSIVEGHIQPYSLDVVLLFNFKLYSITYCNH